MDLANLFIGNIIFLFPLLGGIYSNCPNLIKREGVVLKCTDPGASNADIDCYSGKIPKDTIAKFSCLKSYYDSNDPSNGNGEMRCTNWNNRYRWSSIQQFYQFSCIQTCGISFRGLTPFVIGGVVVSRSKYPWHATLFAHKNKAEELKFICGGTLINPFNKGLVVLTAAHCVVNELGTPRDKTDLKVVLGADSSKLEDNTKVENAQIHDVKSIYVHNSYEGLSFQADIAIIVLVKRVKLSPNVIPACFSPNLDIAKLGTLGEIVGFGQYSFSGGEAASLELRKVELPVVGDDKCFEWRGRKLLSEICAGYEGGKSTCKGDSGGGLLFYNEFMNEKRYFIQGIVSHGRTDEKNQKTWDSYGVFTKVISYSEWIKSTVDQLSLEWTDDDDIAQLPMTPSSLTPVTHHNPVTFAPFIPQVTTSKIPPPPPPPQPPSVQSNFKDYEIASLERHNYFRRMHDAPDLRLSSILCAKSQAYADKLTREGKFENESEEGSIKNIYYITTIRSLSSSDIVVLAVNSWYAAYKDYDFNNPKPTTFSQLVWKGTTELGVGISKGADKTIVVSNYAPPGNLVGENGFYFKSNVSPKKI